MSREKDTSPNQDPIMMIQEAVVGENKIEMNDSPDDPLSAIDSMESLHNGIDKPSNTNSLEAPSEHLHNLNDQLTQEQLTSECRARLHFVTMITNNHMLV